MRVRLVTALLWLALVAPAAAGDTLRCGSRIVALGDSTGRVEALCGAPAWRELHPLPIAPGVASVTEVQLWAYNFGSNRLLQLLRFRHGRLESIESDGYGHPTGMPPDCRPEALAAGLSQYRLLAGCGAPASRQVLAQFAPVHPPYDRWGRPVSWRPVWREEWVYNFGPRQLMRIVTLENGWVVDVEQGRRGYRP